MISRTQIVFLLQNQPLFEIITESVADSSTTLKQIISQILKTISVQELGNIRNFINLSKITFLAYKDQSLKKTVHLDHLITGNQLFFYSLTQQQYQIISGVKRYQVKCEDKEDKETQENLQITTAQKICKKQIQIKLKNQYQQEGKNNKYTQKNISQPQFTQKTSIKLSNHQQENKQKKKTQKKIQLQTTQKISQNQIKIDINDDNQNYQKITKINSLSKLQNVDNPKKQELDRQIKLIKQNNQTNSVIKAKAQGSCCCTIS